MFVPGLLIQLAMFGLFVGFGLIAELRQGVVERMRVTPMSRAAMLLGRSLRDVVILEVQAIVMIVVAIPFGLTVDAQGRYGEFVLPICLVLGFATRLTALALAIATIGFALYVAPALWWAAYVYWVVILLTLVSIGGGAVSIDALLRTLYRRERTPAEMP